MNRGDTAYLMLNYTINGDALTEGAYDEIELQINNEFKDNSIKKLLSKGDIRWGTLTYTEGETEKTFTGYYARLSQEETFSLSNGASEVQLRILINEEVGSSAVTSVSFGNVLSRAVLNDSD